MPEINKLEYTSHLRRDLTRRGSLLREFESTGVLDFSRKFEGVPSGALEPGLIKASDPNVGFQNIFVRVGQNIQIAL